MHFVTSIFEFRCLYDLTHCILFTCLIYHAFYLYLTGLHFCISSSLRICLNRHFFEAELMCRVLLVMHRRRIGNLSQFHLDHLPLVSRCRSIGAMSCTANMLVHILLLLDSIESVLYLFPLIVLPFSLGHCFIKVLVKYLFLFEIGNITCAIVFASFEYLSFLGHGSLLLVSPLLCLQLILLLLYVFHEFHYVFDWVCLFCFILFASWTVHELVLLAHQVFDYSLNLRGEVSLRSIKLKVPDMPRKPAQINW